MTNLTFQTAEELDVRIMIDAEQTYFQPAISRITLEMMRKYNSKKAIVFNTYQCYLKNTYKEVEFDLKPRSTRLLNILNFLLGVH